jgi:hypothetical protein
VAATLQNLEREVPLMANAILGLQELSKRMSVEQVTRQEVEEHVQKLEQQVQQASVALELQIKQVQQQVRNVASNSRLPGHTTTCENFHIGSPETGRSGRSSRAEPEDPTTAFAIEASSVACKVEHFEQVVAVLAAGDVGSSRRARTSSESGGNSTSGRLCPWPPGVFAGAASLRSGEALMTSASGVTLGSMELDHDLESMETAVHQVEESSVERGHGPGSLVVDGLLTLDEACGVEDTCLGLSSAESRSRSLSTSTLDGTLGMEEEEESYEHTAAVSSSTVPEAVPEALN